jgi:glycine/D-amino acid oxidase-like deaminating enzyme
LWLATGHFRNGILLAPATAEGLTQAIVSGRQSPELEAFSLNRFATSTSIESTKYSAIAQEFPG